MNYKVSTYALVIVLLQSAVIYAPFAETLSYEITVGNTASWGVATGAGSVPASSCDVSSLQSLSVNNNRGVAGKLTGSASTINLCPSFAYGVQYWNPVNVVTFANPCVMDELSGQKTAAQGCQGSLVLASGFSQDNISAVSQSAGADLKLKTFASALESKYSYAQQGQKKAFADLYGTVKEQLDFLGHMQTALVPDAKQGQGFLSIPYLKFCSLSSEDALTAKTVQALAKNLYGESLDVSSYFPNATFPVVLDTTVGNAIQPNNSNGKVVSTVFQKVGGVLVRAVEAGLIDAISSQQLLNLFTPVAPAKTQAALKKYGSSMQGQVDTLSVGERALLEEVLFMHSSLLTGIQCMAGVQDATKMQINEGSFYIKGSRRSGRTLTVSELCAKLGHMARYVRGIHTPYAQGRPLAYSPQPVDTFFGVIVVNEGMVQQEPVYVTSENVFDAFIPSKFDKNSKNSAGVLRVDGGVDMWNAAGVNQYSGLKYRAVQLRLTSAQGVLINASYQIQIEEGSGGYVYKDQSADSTSAGIVLVDAAHNVRTEIAQTDLITKFFAHAPSMPWAVVVQVVNQVGIGGQPNPQPSVKVVGLARLNPLHFPLTYLAHESGSQMIVPISTDVLFQSPFQLYNELVSPDEVGKVALKSAAPTTQTVEGTALSLNPVNQNFVKYKGALSYSWQTDFTMLDALKGSLASLKKQYITADKITTEGVLQLVTEAVANQNPEKDMVRVETKTIQLVDVSGQK